MKTSVLHEQLGEQGWCFLSSLTSVDVEGIIHQLGKCIYTTPVTVKPNAKALLTSDRELDFHTDHHKAKHILWHCVKQTDVGGETILTDAKTAYRKLSVEDQQALKEIHLFEHKVFSDDERQHPLVRLDESNEPHFYYSFWLTQTQDKTNPSFLRWRKVLAESRPVTLRLNPGDALVIDNHRILHGRRAIKGTKDRLLMRYWISNI